MKKLSLTAIGRSARWAVIGAVKTTGDAAKSIVEAIRDVLLTTVDGVSQITVAIEKGVAQIIVGAIEAASEVGGSVNDSQVYCSWDCQRSF